MAIGSDNKFPKIIITEGSAPSSPSAGDQKLFIDSADHHLKRKNSSGTVTDIESGSSVVDDSAYGAGWNSDSTHAPSRNAVYDKIESMGSSSAFTQTVNEDGTSFANFTGLSGTWSSDGTVIKQTDTSATARRAKYNNLKVTSHILFEAEIQLKNSGTCLGGLLVGFDGSGNSGIVVYLREDTNVVTIEKDSVLAALSFSVTVNIDTWYKLRLVASGAMVSVYLDGTLLGTAIVASPSVNLSYLGLWSYGSQVWFRNVKAWNLTLPA